MNINLNTSVNTNNLAFSIADDEGLQKSNYEGLIDFIVDIDDYVCDLEFTKLLRDRLNHFIKIAEDES